MSKAKFEAVKELIQTKQYTEARTLLKTIDHATARQWEAKLDRLSPPPEPATKTIGKRGLIIGVTVLGIGIIAALLLVFTRPQSTSLTSPIQVTPTFDQATATNLCIATIQADRAAEPNKEYISFDTVVTHCVERKACEFKTPHDQTAIDNCVSEALADPTCGGKATDGTVYCAGSGSK